jgi:protein O-mannosyl-transferase
MGLRLALSAERPLSLASRRAFVTCGVGVLAFAVYANTLGHGFAYDDQRVITDNPAIRDLTDWRRIFTTPSWFMDGTSTIAFRPLATWTFAANYALHGAAPFGYHLVNVVLHAVASALVVLVATAIGAPPALAGTAGALFAVHPIHTEVVANGVGRAELLAAVLALLALWLRRVAAHSTHPRALNAGSVLAYGLALLSKEHTIGFLVLLPLTDLLLDDDRDLRRFAGRLRGERGAFYAALVLVTLAVLVLRSIAVGSVIGGRDVGNMFTVSYNVTAFAPMELRVLTALAVQSRALWLLVYPMALSADYSYPQITLVTGLGDPRALVGLAVAAGLIGAVLLAWRRSPVACVWVALALLPWAVVSNVILPVGTIFGERLLYLPSAGVCALLAMGVVAIAERVSWRVAGVAVGVLLIAWSARTVTRNRVWASDLALAEATVTDAPRSANAHDNLGRVYVDLGRDDDALTQFAEAAHLLDAHPAWPERLDVLYQIAMVHGRRGDIATSTRLYEEILARAPDWFPALINLGALRNQTGDYARALDAADRAVAVRPAIPNAYIVRGHALRGLGRPREAVAAFDAALERAPGAVEALVGLGAAAYEASDFERAVRAFGQVVSAAPSPDVYRGLVMSLRRAGRAEEARHIAAQAAARYPNEPAFRADAAASPP